MKKTCCILLLLAWVTTISLAQVKGSYYGVAVTRVTTDGSSHDTSRSLYCRNVAGDHLSVYTVEGGIVAKGTAYHISAERNGLYFYALPILPGQQMADSLRIDLEDMAHTVLINKHDRYILYPAYYTKFKREVTASHSVMALLHLLADAIGDYPIQDALPLIGYTPQVDQHIKQAKVMTKRGQSDLIDTWTCIYRYNKSKQLIAVSALDGKIARFTKKIIYSGNNVAAIRSFLNIEDRQITDLTASYDRNDHSLIKWQEHVLETGKNRETDLLTHFTRQDLGMLSNMDLSTVQILNLFKPAKNNGYTKKHID